MQEIGKAIAGFPEYIIGYVLGFVVVALTEVSMTTLVAASVLLGIITSPLIALTVFLFAYVALKAIQSLCVAILHRR